MTHASDLHRRYLSAPERNEYDDMLREVVRATTSTPDRLSLLESKLADAEQAHRPWAILIHQACLRDGLRAEIKRFQDRDRALVSHDGHVLNLPRAQGIKRQQADGQVIDHRVLIEVCTWAEIKEKRHEALQMSKRYTDKVAHYDRLLALREMCPDATSPIEAAKHLGIDITVWLGGIDTASA